VQPPGKTLTTGSCESARRLRVGPGDGTRDGGSRASRRRCGHDFLGGGYGRETRDRGLEGNGRVGYFYSRTSRGSRALSQRSREVSPSQCSWKNGTSSSQSRTVPCASAWLVQATLNAPRRRTREQSLWQGLPRLHRGGDLAVIGGRLLVLVGAARPRGCCHWGWGRPAPLPID